MPIKLKKIDWYVLTEVLGPFLGGVVFFSFVFLMFQALRLADFFIIHGVPGLVLLKMTALMVLSFLPIALPIAFLIGVLVGFGRLSSDSELVAMKANGMSLSQLAIPVVVLSLGVVAFSLALNMTWVPWSDRTFKSTLIKVSNTKVVSSIKEGTFTSGFFDLLIYADKVDVKTNRLHKVFIYDEREPKNAVAVVAREGEIVPVKSGSELGIAAMMRLYNGSIHRNNIATNAYEKIDFGEYRPFLKVDEGADSATLKPRMIPYGLLRQKIQESPRNSSQNRELRTEFWRRYAVAFSPMIFVFLGMGFGTMRTRSVRAGATLIAFGVVVLYWACQAFGTVAAQKGYMPPFFAMQIPNIITLLVAVRSFRVASW